MRFLIVTMFFLSCKTNKPNFEFLSRTQKQEECFDNLFYTDLKDSMVITNLFFSKYEFAHTAAVFPNFIIGVTENNDTIGFVDEMPDDSIEYDIKMGQKLKIIPHNWNAINKKYLKAPFYVVSKKKKMEFYCSIKTVYYCKFLAEVRLKQR